jgi:hypothetical protein
MLDLNSVNGILLAITEGVKVKKSQLDQFKKNEITSTGKKINDILSFRKEIDSDSFLNLSVDQVSNMEKCDIEWEWGLSWNCRID